MDIKVLLASITTLPLGCEIRSASRTKHLLAQKPTRENPSDYEPIILGTNDF